MLLAKKMVGTIALATILASGALSMMAPVHAAENQTPVVYENRAVIDVNGNGRYGTIIPTAITFTDASKTAAADIEIVGVGGFSLDDFAKLKVTTKVKSAGGFQMSGPVGSSGAKYEVNMTGNDAAFTAGTDEKEVTAPLGIGAGQEKKVSGTATYTGNASTKGQYKDTLTYTFTQVDADLK
ncbi:MULTISPECIES: hypothetical protein [Eubacterium]|uniref:WxL domain surface cell wall-binding n=1 Tax=Eubacterium barkeri TaxID=1528 RepID=A0A1H3HY59_EUBBA|nr:hypothetical protein [Eubacterium barkeri]SDY20367.1 hypothetical protein SAMN04488579_1204 [Eubacterium barkeri]